VESSHKDGGFLMGIEWDMSGRVITCG